jgi:predicted TIM-barrel fold metal-dependent hydrolase
MPLIMIRLGVKADRYVYPLMRELKNLYIETSYYLVNDGIDRFVDNFGSSNLVFGTGMPVYSQNPPMTVVALSGINDADKAAIAGKNLAGLLKGVDFSAR